MAATSLKLPDDLKRRLERLAAHARKSPHAYMVEVLAREAERSELRERFAADAALSERQAFASGRSHSLATAFDYLERRAESGKVRRPRPHRWRASK
ncbi:MAG: CopG family ribbon-helix-helix protein [Gammaproteobacteria bacterium]